MYIQVKMIQINNLPNEILLHVLKYVPLETQLQFAYINSDIENVVKKEHAKYLYNMIIYSDTSVLGIKKKYTEKFKDIISRLGLLDMSLLINILECLKRKFLFMGKSKIIKLVVININKEFFKSYTSDFNTVTYIIYNEIRLSYIIEILNLLNKHRIYYDNDKNKYNRSKVNMCQYKDIYNGIYLNFN